MDREEAIELIRSCGLTQYADLIIESLLPSARIIVDGDMSSVASDSIASHFGGLPLLPPNAVWPLWDKRNYLKVQIERLESKFKANPRLTGLRDNAARMRKDLTLDAVPLAFLGQLSLNEIHAAAPIPGWPRDGMCAFFYDASQSVWGFDPLVRGHCRVLFSSERANLRPVMPPNSLPDDAKFPLRRVRFKREWTLPTRITLNDSENISIWGNDEYRELCRQLMPELSQKEPIHRCGGHPQEIQGDMRLECQLVTNGIYCGDSSGYQDPRRQLLEKGAAEWRLLLQIDSDEERLRWMWGDVGRIYFWLRQQDIETADFDSSWAVLQCY